MTICRHFEEITHDEYGDLSDWIMQQDCNYLLGFFPQED